MYTDDQTAEVSYYRVSATSRALFELIVTLYKLQMKYDFILDVVWIVGTRMIHQGMDGLSWGDTNGLATNGMSLSSMVLLHLSSK
jgi:hypothetical protein